MVAVAEARARGFEPGEDGTSPGCGPTPGRRDPIAESDLSSPGDPFSLGEVGGPQMGPLDAIIAAEDLAESQAQARRHGGRRGTWPSWPRRGGRTGSPPAPILVGHGSVWHGSD